MRVRDFRPGFDGWVFFPPAGQHVFQPRCHPAVELVARMVYGPLRVSQVAARLLALDHDRAPPVGGGVTTGRAQHQPTCPACNWQGQTGHVVGTFVPGLPALLCGTAQSAPAWDQGPPATAQRP